MVSHTSNVEWRKLLENFRSAYQTLGPSDILVVELIANSLDAAARRITIATRVEGRSLILRVDDDGRGMKSREEFERYHDLGSLTKVRGGTIGWAGIGAKLYLDKCETVYTETKSTGYSGASEWSFQSTEKAPRWDDVKVRGLVAGASGTSVEVTVSSPGERSFFGRSRLSTLILANYNYALSPLGNVEIYLDGERLVPFDPSGDAKATDKFSLKLKTGEEVSAAFYVLSQPAPSGFELVSIVVNGKTIGDPYDFKQLARIKEIYRVSGFVRCDALVQIVTTSKDSFNRKTPIWFEFNKKVGQRFSEWLEREGALSRLESDSSLEDLATEMGAAINRVLRLPGIRELGLDLFQATTRRATTIADPTGPLIGTETDGTQTTTGTVGGRGEGSGVQTEGDEAGKGLRTDSGGKEPASERTRRVRGGISIAYSDEPGRPERAWLDPGLRAIAINQGHPAFKSADLLNAIPFYTADCCFAIVSESIEQSELREQVLSKLFVGLLGVIG